LVPKPFDGFGMRKMMDGCYKETWFLHEEWGSNHEQAMVQQ
jgi:hypothetical protein